MHITGCHHRLMELFTEPDNLFIDLNQIVIGRNRRIFISYKECIVSERLDFQLIIKVYQSRNFFLRTAI